MKRLSISLFIALVALSVSFAAIAGEKTKASTTQTVSGKLVCIGCSLNHSDGAQAQCNDYGHKGALQTSNGALWSFLENDRSQRLRTDKTLLGKEVKVTSHLIEKAKTIDVDSYEVNGKKMMWCEKCKSMGPAHSH